MRTHFRVLEWDKPPLAGVKMLRPRPPCIPSAVYDRIHFAVKPVRCVM